jgi:hypothetical protein
MAVDLWSAVDGTRVYRLAGNGDPMGMYRAGSPGRYKFAG